MVDNLSTTAMASSKNTDPKPFNAVDLETIIDSITNIVWTATADGTPEYFSKRGAEYSGLENSDSVTTLVHPDDLDRVTRAWEDAVAKRAPYEVELRLRRHDGTYRRHLFNAQPVRDAAGDVVRWVGTATDIEDQRGLEERLRQTERRGAEVLSLLETVQSAAPVGLGFCDREFRMIRANDALAATSGVSAEEQIGRTVPEIIPELWPELGPVYRSVLETGEPVINIEAAALLPGGSEHPQTWLTSFYPVHLEGEVIGIGTVVVDITQRKAMERQLENLADRDPLTGIYNRRRLLIELKRVLSDSARYGRPGAVLVLDIDNFKLTNDSYGHLAGDHQLKSVAKVVGDRLRETDIVARTGGDEFAVILPESTPEQALKVSVEMRAQLCERPSGPPVRVSIGIADFGGAGNVTTDELLAAADSAMYESKEAGGDRATVYGGAAANILARARHLQDALDGERFVLYSQPIVEIRSGRVDHRELLIRMLSEDGEIIPTGEFMPLAEEFALVGQIDRWVVGEAVGLARREPLSVNLSGRSVGDPEILSDVQEAIATGLDPRNLTFELTETAVMADLDRALDFVTELGRLGCEIALDDFGTGFGTFTYLKNLPARYLKIDMQFVRGINDDPVDRVIVESIITFARVLGKDTIAEGVESAEVLETLRELGVDYGQGWHFGAPEPVRGGIGEPREPTLV